MSVLLTLKRLVLGETWLLPLGVGGVVVAVVLVVRPLLGDAWHHAGGFVLLGGMAAVLVVSVVRGALPRDRTSTAARD